MKPPTLIWLRDELKPLEHRTPLTPQGCELLLKQGYEIVVERSQLRIFPDKEYEKAGCTLVPSQSWMSESPERSIILGLKEIEEYVKVPLKNSHIHFGHLFKNQKNWKNNLSKYVKGQGKLYDLEFLVNDQGRRVAAFGYFAGFVGCAIGLKAWLSQALGTKLGALQPYANDELLLDELKQMCNQVDSNERRWPKVMVIGALGRCGKGAIDFAKRLGIPSENITGWDINETIKGGPFPEILEHDLFINCICLREKIPPFLTSEMLNHTRQLSVIVDVSCDYTNPNNPIPIYDQSTSFPEPILDIPTESDKPLQVISIDHLPSLLPKESSQQFCQDLMPYLSQLKEIDSDPVWQAAEKVFREKYQQIADEKL